MSQPRRRIESTASLKDHELYAELILVLNYCRPYNQSTQKTENAQKKDVEFAMAETSGYLTRKVSPSFFGYDNYGILLENLRQKIQEYAVKTTEVKGIIQILEVEQRTSKLYFITERPSMTEIISTFRKLRKSNLN